MNTLIPLADGVEEMEAVIVIDVLRRAEWNVVTAGFYDGAVTASRGVRLLPDVLWSELDPEEFEMIVIPGGADGVRRLRENKAVMETVKFFQRRERWISAICAGPLLLESAGILRGRRVTAHPAVIAELKTAIVEEEAVVRDGRIITGRGPGAAMLFALTLVACVKPAMSGALAEAMVCAPDIGEALSRIMDS